MVQKSYLLYFLDISYGNEPITHQKESEEMEVEVKVEADGVIGRVEQRMQIVREC